jgi:hypothetical protein
MSEFKIDFFELLFLAEVCIPPTPIARGMFWDNLCDRYYNQMSDNERSRAFGWITKRHYFNLENEDCHLFFARYNPDNQFKVHFFYEGKVKIVDCFRFNGLLHTNKTTHVVDEYITKIEKINHK